MFVVPRKPGSARQSPDRLINELGRIERRLQSWIGSSEENAQMFREDPIRAMRAAGLEMEDDLICELEMIMNGIARKFGK